MNKMQENLQHHREIASQLKTEAEMQRLPVSECVEEMKKYCDKHMEVDMLIMGFTKQNENPFKEKGGCAVL